jgi:3-oxoacyl-[acyl-carrier-protein] synthase II
MSNPALRRVVVTGVGLVNPFGGDVEDFWSHLMRGDSAIRFYAHPAAPESVAQPAVRCASFNPEQLIGKAMTSLTDRYSQLGVAAAYSAWDNAGLLRNGADRGDDWGVSWGTGGGGTLTFDKGYIDFYERGRRRLSPLTVPQAMNNAAASHVAIALGLGGSCLTYSVACASSAVSIGEACRRIQFGQDRLVVAGGSEAPLSLSFMLAWDSMRVIAIGDEETAYRACRPFQEGRTGLVLGEGAAAMVLEDMEHARARGARIYCELVGYGQSCDHLHVVRPDAPGQVRAINAALREAGLSPDEVGYVNAHGTATPEGDPIEITALKECFGEAASRLCVSATKSMHGHMLGGAGAMEAVITVLALAKQQIPPTAHLDQVAADCTGVRHVMGTGISDVTFKAAISNSFAFGGSNAVLAFRQVD